MMVPWPMAATLAQNTGNEIFWAGQNNNSSLRMFSWQETSNTYFWNNVNVRAGPMALSPLNPGLTGLAD